MKQRDPMRLEWLGFVDFSAALLYQVVRFRQAIFVVEQRCAYPDPTGSTSARAICCCGAATNSRGVCG